MAKAFIDGKEGTTGLEIYNYLGCRKDIQLIMLDEKYRKDAAARKAAIAQSDITILCLPDAAAIEAVAMAEDTNAKIIDASTAHRTSKGWAYGFAELGAEFEQNIKTAKRVAVPGCHASGVLALIYPLIKLGLLPKNYPLACTSITGYSGGGKKMIADYTAANRSPLLDSPRLYALTQEHKHLKEITGIAGLCQPPIFCPIVGDFYSGMEVIAPLYSNLLASPCCVSDLYQLYKNYYANQKLINVMRTEDEDYSLGGFVASNLCSGQNGMSIIVAGNNERLLPIAVYDNLRKGAAAAAVECLNLMMGEQKEKGLI